jgi:uncharacterized SAM-dependent methyltransferase
MSAAHVAIHPSQFPENVHRDLLDSLRNRQVNHKFHYDSFKQAAKWLAVHEALSPARTDPQCLAIYEQAFEAAARMTTFPRVHVIGLGCGGGQKDARLLRLLTRPGCDLRYTPCDVSVPLTLVARGRALEFISEHQCHPLVCDLANADDLLPLIAGNEGSEEQRLFTFFGMIPNFEPRNILPRLAALIHPRDQLLFSANLASGQDYRAGVERILPLYDNALTRDWLSTWLFDLGIDPDAGTIRMDVEMDDASNLLRIAAHWEFSKTFGIEVSGESFSFQPGDRIRLFFSYRHTPELIRRGLQEHGLSVRQEWIASSEEEGVFLCARD